MEKIRPDVTMINKPVEFLMVVAVLRTGFQSGAKYFMVARKPSVSKVI
ncbi:hypothetical protein LS482_01260 [Sinomicrobium kalidii]|nr:hypothetical protein [Sinomicrobium kalidii]UGU16509.1 hypothetical protein LS482_01260 [Sinomicrobium kalidii]